MTTPPVDTNAIHAKALRGCLPALIEAEAKLRASAAALSILYDIADYGALRTKAIVAQLQKWRDEAVAEGEPYYRVSDYIHGYHPRGAAFDIKITSWPHQQMSSNQAYATLGQLAPTCGLRWGGHFPPPADIYHFELAITLLEATNEYAAFSGVTVPLA
jgi:hypothetical protein